MTNKIFIVGLCGLLLVGCGGDGAETAPMSAEEVADAEKEASVTEQQEAAEVAKRQAEFDALQSGTGGAPAVPAAPPVPGVPGVPSVPGQTMPAANAAGGASALGDFAYDVEGNAVTALSGLNSAMLELSHMHSSWTLDGINVPPITNVNQLVQYKVIAAVPAPPAGKSYKVDPKTLKVTLE